MFELFDPAYDVRITAGKLPHWYQPGVTYFVTFRTEDSLPRQVAETWHRRRDDWLRRRRINPISKTWRESLHRLPLDKQRQYHKLFSEEYLTLLDKGWGKCVLKQSELAAKVVSSLNHFDGERYHLGDCVVIPNHVHLLVGLVGDTEIERQCHSWKKFSAGEINRALGRDGRFWQEESFDHLVRSPESFERFQRYIADNGPGAGLAPNEYVYQRSKHAT